MKMMGKVSLWLAVALGLFAPVTASELLKGVGHVGILLGQLDPRVESAGVAKDGLMGIVEGKLKKNGFDSRWEAGKPFLNIRVRAIALSEDTLVCHLQVSLNEVASLKRNLAWISATTWSQSSLLVAPVDEIQAQVTRIAGEMVDQFIKDYMSANRKGPGR